MKDHADEPLNGHGRMMENVSKQASKQVSSVLFLLFFKGTGILVAVVPLGSFVIGHSKKGSESHRNRKSNESVDGFFLLGV